MGSCTAQSSGRFDHGQILFGSLYNYYPLTQNTIVEASGAKHIGY